MEITIRVTRLSDNAILPKKNSIGYDLYASTDCVIPAWGKNVVRTDLSILIPEGYYGRIVSYVTPWKHTNVNGIIEPSYRSPIGIVMVNQSFDDILISTHDKVAQLIIEKVKPTVMIES
jgi:dUTP pyrophosphatase